MKILASKVLPLVLITSLSAVVARAAAPAAPARVQPSTLPAEVMLTWPAVSGAMGYKVYRYDAANNSWPLLAVVTSPRFRGGMPAILPARHVVTAINADGESAVSPEAVAQRGAGFALSLMEWDPPTDSEAWVAWAVGAVAGADGMVELGMSPTNFAGIYGWETNYLSWHSFHLTNLAPGTTYYYRITTVGTNRVGVSYVNSFTTLGTQQAALPTAQPGSATTSQGAATMIQLNGSDPGARALTFTIVSGPTNGSLGPVAQVSSSTANIVYTPRSGARGADSFLYKVNNGSADSVAARVGIVNNLSLAPVAANGSVATAENTPVNVTLSGSDPDGDALSFTVVNGPAHGTLTGIGASRIYTPAANYSGTDSFTFRVNDGAQNSAVATVGVSVTAVNDAPIIEALGCGSEPDGSIHFTALASDPDGNPLTYRVVTSPSYGTVTISPEAGNEWIYRPAADYNGPDSFVIVASDGVLDSAPATMTVVTPVDRAVLSTNQSLATAEDTAVIVVPDAGDGMNYVLLAAPSHGLVTANGGALVYTPAANYTGPDSFDYQATKQGSDAMASTVTVEVMPVNDPPVANALSGSVDQDRTAALTLTGSDVEGSALNFIIVTAPAHGTLGGSGANWTYTPSLSYSGTDSFTFKVNDGSADSAPATVSISVNAVNHAPVANAQAVATSVNTPVNIVLNGSDADGSALAFSIVSQPANGVLSGSGANFTFTPATGWSGTTTFAFKVNDGALDSAPATVTISVANLNVVAPPAAPGGLTATAVSRSQINLTWTDNSSNETGFKIERSKNGTSSWKEIGTVGANVVAYSNTGLSSKKQYYYRVRASNSAGDSAYSGTATAKTLN